MAQPQQQQFAPRAFSPLQSGSSPTTNHPSFFGPNKRQRLSPTSQSPYGSPSIANIALPNQVFSSPYYGAQPNGSMPPNTHQAATPPPQSGAMGPPSRPMDNKPTDMNELTDVLLGSGIDLKAEEAALLSRYNPSSQVQADTAVTSNLANSFNFSGSTFLGGGTAAAKSNASSQNIPSDRNNFYGAGTFNQLPGPYQSQEDQANADRKRALQRKLERQQYHLNDPFLFTSLVRQRMEKQARIDGAHVPTTGLLSSTHRTGQPTEIAVTGPDKNEVVVSLNGEDLLYLDAPLVEILTLVSLATEKRLGAIVDDAATLAKGRRIGSHGAVPADLVDLATGDGAFETVNSLPTPGNSAVSPKTNPLKRSYSSVNKPLTPISTGSLTPNNTVASPNPVAQALHRIAKREREEEEERVTKRARRVAAAALAGDTSKSGSASLGTSAPGTPAVPGDRAPDVEVKKGTKKEQKRQAEAKATETQQHAATTSTMNLALGIGGSLGKALSWMKPGGANAAGSSKSSMLPRVNTSSQGVSRSAATAGAGSGSSNHNQLHMGRKYGEFREDKVHGAGIQLRDVIGALESDGKQKKTLQRAYSRLHQADGHRKRG